MLLATVTADAGVAIPVTRMLQGMMLANAESNGATITAAGGVPVLEATLAWLADANCSKSEEAAKLVSELLQRLPAT